MFVGGMYEYKQLYRWNLLSVLQPAWYVTIVYCLHASSVCRGMFSSQEGGLRRGRGQREGGGVGMRRTEGEGELGRWRKGRAEGEVGREGGRERQCDGE